MSDEIPKRFGKYDVVSILGQGAMGVVYEGHDATINRRVAIKTLHTDLLEGDEREDSLARFKREAQAAGRLNHPGIVMVYDFGEENGTAYMVMEFLEGKSLREVFDADQKFADSQIGVIMEQVLDGLGYAHENGIVHRDIKPANLMVADTENIKIKITDFGIARIDSTALTQVGTAVGTPGYMSPEQFMGQDIDSRSDIFSCGVLLYQLLTGEKPFSGSVTATMHKVLKEIPINPSDLNFSCSPEIDAVVQKAMAKRPADRYQTAAEFILDIKLMLDGNGKKPLAAAVDPDATVVLSNAGAGIGTDDRTEVLKPALGALSPGNGKSKGLMGVGALIGVVAIGVVAWAALKPEEGSLTSTLNAPAALNSEPAAESALATKAPISVKSGSVMVSTTPPGARVHHQNGTFYGLSPITIKLVEGEHELIISKGGFYEVSASIEVEAGDEIPFEVSLTEK